MPDGAAAFLKKRAWVKSHSNVIQWEFKVFLFHSFLQDKVRTVLTMETALSPAEICCHVSRPDYLILSVLKSLLLRSPATKMSENASHQARKNELLTPQQTSFYSRHANEVTLTCVIPLRKGPGWMTQSPTGKIIFLSSWNYALQRLAVIRCMRMQGCFKESSRLISCLL